MLRNWNAKNKIQHRQLQSVHSTAKKAQLDEQLNWMTFSSIIWTKIIVMVLKYIACKIIKVSEAIGIYALVKRVRHLLALLSHHNNSLVLFRDIFRWTLQLTEPAYSSVHGNWHGLHLAASVCQKISPRGADRSYCSEKSIHQKVWKAQPIQAQPKGLKFPCMYVAHECNDTVKEFIHHPSKSWCLFSLSSIFEK